MNLGANSVGIAAHAAFLLESSGFPGVDKLVITVSETPFFRTLIATDMQQVDRVIRSQLHSDVALIRQVAEYIISAGGKRLRPMLTLLAGRACAYDGEHLYSLAAMVESPFQFWMLDWS